MDVICIRRDDHDIVYLRGVQRQHRSDEHRDPRGGGLGDRAVDLRQRDADHVVGVHADRQGLRADREAVAAVRAAAQSAVSRRRGGFGRISLYLNEHQRQFAGTGQCRYTARDQGDGGAEKA